VLCCPSTTTKHTSISVRWRAPVACCGAGVFKTRLRLIFRARRYDHVQPLLKSLHWLRVPERISFWLAVLVYLCLHNSASGYLASDLQHVSDLGARQRLRLSSTSALVAPRTVRATIGNQAFPAAAASVWNSLPETVRASPSLPVFCWRLKTKLFVRSYSCSASWASHCTDYYVTSHYCYVSLQS